MFGKLSYRCALFIGAAVLVAPLSACEGMFSGFDRATWASGKGNFDGKNARAAMVADARTAGLVIGADRKDVRTLLGEPDSTGETWDVYFTGQNLCSVDFGSLHIHYDAGGRVATTEKKQT